MQFIYLAEAMLVLLLSFEILSDLNNCNSPESAALEGIFKAGWVHNLRIKTCVWLPDRCYTHTLTHSLAHYTTQTHDTNTHCVNQKQEKQVPICQVACSAVGCVEDKKK